MSLPGGTNGGFFVLFCSPPDYGIASELAVIFISA